MVYKTTNVTVIPSKDSSKGNSTPQAFIIPISVKHDVRDSFKASFYNELQEQLAKKVVKGSKLLDLQTYNKYVGYLRNY